MKTNLILAINLIISSLLSNNVFIRRKIDWDTDIIQSNRNYSSNIDSYDNFMEAYFDNSTENYGINYKGSCGYVAMGLILTYYDSALNDNIVPEIYDKPSVDEDYNVISRRNSPGTNQDIIDLTDNEIDQLTSQEYYNYVVEMSSYSLHSKLLLISESLGYYGPHRFAGSDYPSRKQILQTYLSTVGQTNYVFYESPGSTSLDVKTFTINQILQGRPVLLSIGNDYGGHACVAYDYDSTSDSVYCHMGWGADKTRVTPESQGYNEYWSAISIQFNVSHSHSMNYGVCIGGVTNYYCYDSRHIHTIHNHSYSYSNITSSKHTYTCNCGICVEEEHNWVENQTVSLRYIPIYECYYCGYQTRIPPEFN